MLQKMLLQLHLAVVSLWAALHRANVTLVLGVSPLMVVQVTATFEGFVAV